MPPLEDKIAALDALANEICRQIGDGASGLQFHSRVDGTIPSLVISHREWPGEAKCFAFLTRPGTISIAAPGEPYEARYNLHLRRIPRRPKVDLNMMPTDRIVRAISDWLCVIEKDARVSHRRKTPSQTLSLPPEIILINEPLAEPAPDPEFEDGVRRLLAQNFPQDAQGKLALDTTVLLAPRDLESARILPGRRDLWYAAIGPKRRRDPQTVRIGWHWLIAENNTHRWDGVPWLWNPIEAARTSDAERLGIPENLPWHRLGKENRAENLAALAEDTILAGRIAHTILLQDEGRITEALAKWDIRISDRVSVFLAGREDLDKCDAIRTALSRAALWRIPPLIEDERKRLAEWRAAKKGRAKKIPTLPFFHLPHEMSSSRSRLFLGEDEDGQIAFYIESTACEARLPIVSWQRPAEIDFRRFGLWKENYR